MEKLTNENKEPKMVVVPTAQDLLETMYMMQVFAGYVNQYSGLKAISGKDPHNLKAMSQLEKVESNLNALEPILAKKQQEMKDYLCEKHDIVLQ